MHKATSLTLTIPLLTVAFNVSSLTSQLNHNTATSEQQNLTQNTPLADPFLPDNGDYHITVDFENSQLISSDRNTENSTESLSIHSDGIFTYNGSGSCKASGNFETDTSEYNRLGVKIIFEHSCFPMVGTHKGHVWKNHQPDQDDYRLIIYSSLDQSTKAIGWRLNKVRTF